MPLRSAKFQPPIYRFNMDSGSNSLLCFGLEKLHAGYSLRVFSLAVVLSVILDCLSDNCGVLRVSV